MVAAVSATEPRFSGYTVLPTGVFAEYTRDVTYSDGTVRNELVESRPSGFLLDKTMGEVYEDYPAKPPKWGARVYYPGIVPMSRRVHGR